MKLYQNTTILVMTTLLVIFLSFVVIFEDYGSQNNSRNNKITGDVTTTKVELYPTLFRNCTFYLNPGWNMVSFYCLGLLASRDNTLSSISGSYSSIFKYQSNDPADHWKSYNPYLPNWTIQQLNYLDRVSGYWVYMFNGANFSYPGVYSDSNIYLYDGWNLVGYPHKNTTDINISLNGIPYSVVKHYTRIQIPVNVTHYIIDNITGNITGNFTTIEYTDSDVWLIHIYNASNNTLEHFETYKGYWVNVTDDSTWHIVR